MKRKRFNREIKRQMDKNNLLAENEQLKAEGLQLHRDLEKTKQIARKAEAERDRLREALEIVKKYAPHKSDTSDLEVCYDWCPACIVKEALNK